LLNNLSIQPMLKADLEAALLSLFKDFEVGGSIFLRKQNIKL
jgi:hypothetical protein